MSLDCKQVIEKFSLHQQPDLTYQEKIECRRHLIECKICQSEYEEMLHTAAVLESIPDPVPPPELVERIQTQIRQTDRRSVLDFLVNPIARILVAVKRLNWVPTGSPSHFCQLHRDAFLLNVDNFYGQINIF